MDSTNIDHHDTPTAIQQTTGKSYRIGTLHEKRQTVIDDVGEPIPEVSVDYFLNNLWPPLPQGISLEAVMDHLLETEILTETGWSCFSTDPALSDITENKTFAPLAGIFKDVVAAAKMTGRSTASSSASRTAETEGYLELQTYTLILRPNSTPESDRSSKTRPDAFMIDFSAGEHLEDPKEHDSWSWSEMALTGEWKSKGSSNTERDSNVSQEVFNLQQTMTLDPRRRFTRGVTIENKGTRLWFCSRAVMMVSESFDFFKSPEKLARVFLSLAFATEVDMGWDPTMSVAEPPDETQYDIYLSKTVYKTSKVLSDFAADSVLGRATRVFKVTDPEGTTRVLKDFWMDDDRLSEEIIQGKIEDAVREKFGDPEANRVKNHFMTIIDSWVVEVSKGIRDHSIDVMMCRNLPQEIGKFYLRTKPPVAEEGVQSRSDVPLLTYNRFIQESARMTICKQIHVRTVYQDMARTVVSLQELEDVFLVLEDAVEALFLIHKAGWVHRDISAANLYLCSDQHGRSCRGLLGDLEYAKGNTDDTVHEVRTGTYDFMASEVISRSWLYRNLDSASDTSDRSAQTHPLPTSSLPFRQNFLHDLESIWWVAVWVVFSNEDEGNQRTASEINERNHELVKLFPRTDDFGWREDFFYSGAYFGRVRRLLPKKFQRIAKKLHTMANLLSREYKSAEESLPTSLATVLDTTKIHEQFKDILKELRTDSKGIILFFPGKLAKISQKRKDIPSSDSEPVNRDDDEQPHATKKLKES